MQGPWYEANGPSKEEIHHILYKALIESRDDKKLNIAISKILAIPVAY